ncbi:hypothetical protein ALC60_13783 [Trachymyrmex zeteki]|uniref:Endonuclease/exonuclease/phosphatase domain-containing protein n=1 Tax=Mycetomoellerius zeteki TaxID=64791 RepID=A0A151WH93_9HYME|nr:hypothetical protein ALC60_13783 [Trachymyrmex zeteki]
MNSQQPTRSQSYVSSQPLRIAYWNFRGAYFKKPEIDKISEELDIIIIAETCLSPDHAFSIRGFDCIRLDSTSNNIRGLLILIRNSILFSIVDIQFNFLPALEILAVKIHLKDSILNIVGAYRHPSIPMTNSIINSFYSFMSQFNSVINDLLVSDHFPIYVSLNSLVRSVDIFSHRTHLSRLQWQCVAAWLEVHAGDIARETSEAALFISP